MRKTDRVGSEVEFNFGRDPRYQTICGGITTLLQYSLILAVIYTFVMKLWVQKEPETTISESFTSEYPRIELYENMIYPIFALLPSSYGIDPSTPQTQISAEQFSIYATIYALNIKLGSNLETPTNPQDFSVIKFKPCAKIAPNFALANITSTSSQVKEFINSNGMCMDLTEEELKKLYVANNTFQLPYAQLLISVKPCLSTNPSCAPADLLENRDLLIILPKRTFDPKNETDPVSLIANLDWSELLDHRQTRSLEVLLKQVNIYDEKVDFFSETLKSNYSEVD